jgi:hypothetical protein
LKAIVSKSVAHALVPKKPTVSTNTGLRLHEFILERDSFLARYAQGLDPENHPEAISGSESLRYAIDELNADRLPKLSVTGSREQLLENIVTDNREHLAHVTDTSSLSVADLKKRIKFINSDPRRGLLSKSGTNADLITRLRDAGYEGEIWPELVEQHAVSVAPREVLPYDEYQKYEDMYQSLLAHLRAGASGGDRLMEWLLYAFTTPDVMKTEVSIFSKSNKCRFDALFKAGKSYIAPDLKMTKDASDVGFMWEAAKYGYDIQVAHYTDTASEEGVNIQAMPLICIEPIEPYAVNVFVPNDEFIETGFRKRQWAIEQHKKWLASDSKTAYTPKSKELVIPERYMRGPWDESRGSAGSVSGIMRIGGNPEHFWCHCSRAGPRLKKVGATPATWGDVPQPSPPWCRGFRSKARPMHRRRAP